MNIVTYKMVGFDDNTKYPGQDDWQDLVYAGDDGSILVLLGTPYRAKNARQGASFPWHFDCDAEAGDWFRLRQRREPINGRWYVVVRAKKKGRKCHTHRIVLYAWHRPPDDDRRLGLHNDDDSSNNRKENLRWGTARENQEDRQKNRKREVKQLSGVSLNLVCNDEGWDIEVRRNGEVHVSPEAPGIASPRRSDPKRLLCQAIDELRGKRLGLAEK